MIVNGHDFKQVNGSKTLLIPLVLMIRHNLFFKEIALQICAPHHVVFSNLYSLVASQTIGRKYLQFLFTKTVSQGGYHFDISHWEARLLDTLAIASS